MNVNPFAWSFRVQFLFGFAVSASLLAYAVFAQYGQFYEPCPLCIFQRVAMAATAVVGLVGGLHAPRAAWGRRAYGLLAFLAAGTGAAIAGRHVWLQHLPPDQVPACGPGLSYMVESMPSWLPDSWNDRLRWARCYVTAGQANCRGPVCDNAAPAD